MNNMGKVEKIVQSAPNGIITAAQLTKAGLHRGYLHDFVESGELYRFGRGLYVQSGAWEMIFTCCSGSIAAASIRMIPPFICWAILTAPRQDTR